MGLLPVLLGSFLLLLLARADSAGGGTVASSPVGERSVGPEDLALHALLISQLPRPEKLSQLDAVKRPQRQIRFKSSYRELPAGLKSTFLDGASQNLEGLSYFIQVEVEDPPASTALTKLPKGAKTYFPPQLSEPDASLLQEDDSDDDTTTQQLFLVGSSSSPSQAFSQGAAKAHEKALLGSKTDISRHPGDVTLNSVSLTVMDDNAPVTSPSTSTLLTYPYPETPPSTTENPNIIPKGFAESSSYTSYSPTNIQVSKNASYPQDYKSYPASVRSSLPSSVSLSSLRSSRPSSSPRIHYASPSPLKFISSYSLTPSAPSSSASQSFSSYTTPVSTAVKSPSVSPASNSVSSYSFVTSSPSALPRKPSTSQPYSTYSFTTVSPVSSTSKSLTNVSPVTSVSKSFRTSVGSLAPPLSSTNKSLTAYPFVLRSKSHSSQSFTTPSSSASSYKSVINYSFTSPSPSASFPPVFKNRKNSQTHLTKSSLSSTIPSGASSSKISPASPLPNRSQKSFFQVTRPSNRPSTTSTVFPKRSSNVRNKVSFDRKHLKNLSPPKISANPSPSAKPLTSSYTLTKHRSRPTHTQSSSNIVTQSRPEPRAKSFSSGPTKSFQDITTFRRSGDGGGRSGERPASLPKTPGLDGKTRTVGSSTDPYAGSIPGRSGVDYPTLLTIPKTGFDCSSKPSGGYYADVETNCQVFHMCWSGRSASFLCPVGTVFSQQLLVCDWWYNVDCSTTQAYYHANHGIW